MNRDTAIEWTSRIGNERLTKDDIYWVWEITEDKLTPYGSRFPFVGEELDAEFMVFKEGEQEKLARKLLEEEGLGHLEFATRLD
ncbi:uncharacterized protein EV420DRAFT_1639663 [Desarmillaria tabescens]|uniref:Uncharacterized protein n=1 Tax=Armillaria tabescens TaxID=1929756 RepID=A0AA39NB96_ARMTA|nr:uncharacterized protein EV420DRAFT_1639663 [Desarmillaria tabescens]KAK0462441.1 hypothetical protein EV420DRAFT_1639663 [Desarmillaria tabescens]